MPEDSRLRACRALRLACQYASKSIGASLGCGLVPAPAWRRRMHCETRGTAVLLNLSRHRSISTAERKRVSRAMSRERNQTRVPLTDLMRWRQQAPIHGQAPTNEQATGECPRRIKVIVWNTCSQIVPIQCCQGFITSVLWRGSPPRIARDRHPSVTVPSQWHTLTATDINKLHDDPSGCQTLGV